MSRLARLSLANRSVVALVTIAIAVFGWFSLGSLKQELIPSLQIPTAVVVAVDPGSSPELVEQQLTEPIEQAVSGVADVESGDVDVRHVGLDDDRRADLRRRRRRAGPGHPAGGRPDPLGTCPRASTRWS